ncbi:MAG: hypothetical protein IKM09_02330 [Clostridia bacterium]|nr:hypothetical protein [Clostridia bacterium]
MFSLKLQNACKDYKVFLDGEELAYKECNGYYLYTAQNLIGGGHIVRIIKNRNAITLGKLCLFWLSAFSGGDDNVALSLYRSAKYIDKEFFVSSSDDLNFCYDTYQNKVVSCSGEYRLVKDICLDDEKTHKKIKLWLRFPILILVSLVLLPVWILSVFMMLKSFSIPAFLLFILVSSLIVLFIISFFRDKKNGW